MLCHVCSDLSATVASVWSQGARARGPRPHGGCGEERWGGCTSLRSLSGHFSQTCCHLPLGFLEVETFYSLIFKANKGIVFYYLKPKVC